MFTVEKVRRKEETVASRADGGPTASRDVTPSHGSVKVHGLFYAVNQQLAREVETQEALGGSLGSAGCPCSSRFDTSDEISCGGGVGPSLGPHLDRTHALYACH